MTPVEVISDAEGNKHDIASSTCYGTVGGSGTIGGATNAGVAGSNYTLIDDAGNATSGYINGAKQYISVASAADATGAALSALTGGGTADGESGIFIKNTGFQFSSVTELGSASTAGVMLVVRAIASQSASTTIASTTELASGDEPIVAVLDAGEAIFLPLRRTMLAEKFSLAASTIADNGGITAGSETIAAQVLVF